jgi:uncharacterized BrkB/YihY/UPF0761 family membrane protein
MTSEPVPKRVRPVWDIVVTIILLVLTIGTLGVSVFADLFLAAFTDYCPDPCHVDAGLGAVQAVWIICAAVALLATVASILLLVFRRRAWWVALVGWVLVLAGSVIAVALYMNIVGN